ncbi:UrcA family protein [Peristeroidobacter soli]|jgi:UrcA family protein|uniref:UrcA family protein n=1 Tax=Peristeroidobacter soli TaxID=2497877 RepID=UPI00101D8B3D|nr:UrcA family protein [Peristeroidobacter soli]
MSSHKTFRVARYVAACAVTALSFGVAAHAGEVSTDVVGPATTTVRYGDLDLSKQADAQKLYGRLQRASDNVCGEYKELRNLQKMKLYNVCYQDALARAVDTVGHAAVKAAYAADDKYRFARRSTKSQASI